MKKIFKIRTGGMFHGTTYIVVADNESEAIQLMSDECDETVTEDEIEEIVLDESGIVASGEFHWMYHK